MAPHARDEWSDSDDEGPSGVETSVLLGVPDGPVNAPTDLSDAAVSRIGGHPVRYVLCVYAIFINFRKRPSCLFLNLQSHRLIAKYVITQWNSLFKCGAPLRIVPWTERYMSGAVLEPLVRGNKVGTLLWHGVYAQQFMLGQRARVARTEI